MSNILIIKHGSLGDLIQANGAFADIKNSFKNSKVLLLTTQNFTTFMSECPYLDGVLMDKRLPRWNLLYLMNLKKLLERYNFSHVFDLQNSSRTNFYRKFILKSPVWCSSETSLEKGQSKKDFDKESVLDRMEIQLKKFNIHIEKLKNIDLSWSIKDISRLLKQYTNGSYILVFPFCSKKNSQKKWPYYKELITRLKSYYKNKFSVLIAPGPDEIFEAKNLNAQVVLDNKKNSINLDILVSLISNSSYIISNDSGPAHISSHLRKKGLAIFGKHTSPKKVNVGNSEFKTIEVESLKDLNVNSVLEKIKKDLN